MRSLKWVWKWQDISWRILMVLALIFLVLMGAGFKIPKTGLTASDWFIVILTSFIVLGISIGLAILLVLKVLEWSFNRYWRRRDCVVLEAAGYDRAEAYAHFLCRSLAGAPWKGYRVVLNLDQQAADPPHWVFELKDSEAYSRQVRAEKMETFFPPLFFRTSQEIGVWLGEENLKKAAL